jgi:hypothetical protein
VEREIGVRPITGEASPYYLFHPLAPERIASTLPAVKVIVLLRDPVERAYSAYTHEFARGFETETFERALELEEERLHGEVERILEDPSYNSRRHQHNAYLSRGRYVDQLQRYEAALGRDRMHVIDSQSLFDAPDTEYSALLSFLGLPPEPHPVVEKHNARPRSAMPKALRSRLLDELADADERLARWWGRTPSWRV